MHQEKCPSFESAEEGVIIAVKINNHKRQHSSVNMLTPAIANKHE